MDRISKCILGMLTASAIGALTYTEGYAQEANQPVCGPTQSIDAFLRGEGYAEASFGIINPQAAMLIYATPDGERWAVILVGTDGQACFSFEGTDYFPGAVQEAPIDGERAA